MAAIHVGEEGVRNSGVAGVQNGECALVILKLSDSANRIFDHEDGNEAKLRSLG
jgi:hypothetical protein